MQHIKAHGDWPVTANGSVARHLLSGYRAEFRHMCLYTQVQSIMGQERGLYLCIIMRKDGLLN